MSDADERPVELLAVGDIMTGCAYFHSLVGDSIPTVLDDPKRSLIANDVERVLTDADVLFGNLECVVSQRFSDDDDGIPPRIMGPASSIGRLADAGFDVLNLANNHITDHGPEFIAETTDLLDAHGIDYVGNPLEEEHTLIRTVRGRKFAIHGLYVPFPEEDGELDRVLSAVDAVDGPDVRHIVSLHWGVHRAEHVNYPAPEQVRFGRALVDRGVDVVLGHHSHTFQSVERYGEGIIAYSLGNFIFDMWREKNRKSGILKLQFDPDGTIGATILPVEQREYQVTFSDGSHVRDIQKVAVEPIADERYHSMSKRMRRAHRSDVIAQLAKNFHRFPPGYHVSTLRRWIGKAKREFTTPCARGMIDR